MSVTFWPCPPWDALVGRQVHGLAAYGAASETVGLFAPPGLVIPGGDCAARKLTYRALMPPALTWVRPGDWPGRTD